MLKEKIHAARKARSKQVMKLGLSVAGLLTLCVVVLVFSTSCCDFEKKEVVELEQELIQQKPITFNTDQVPTVDDGLARQQYLDTLNDFKTRLEPELANIDFSRWRAEQMSKLTVLKDNALDEFAAASYTAALEHIEQASDMAEALIKDASDEFQQAMADATLALQEDDYDQARLNIDKALLLDQKSTDAKEIAARISRLGEIIPLLDAAAVARIENNQEKELDIIEQILSLAPEREQEQARKQALLEQISLQRHQNNIATAYRAINNKDVASAKKHLSNARKIYPSRSEVKDVSSALQQLEQQLTFERYYREANDAIAKDDWLEAKTALSLALKEKPNNLELQDLLKQTNQVLSLQSTIEKHINSPYRLADSNVNGNARSTLEQARSYRDASLRLDNGATQLQALLENMNRDIEVVVKSDNKTNVLVRGVGIVGLTESKTIQLKPGQYKFEGKRKGYKSKLIDVLVPYDKNRMQLTVICDEPI